MRNPSGEFRQRMSERMADEKQKELEYIKVLIGMLNEKQTKEAIQYIQELLRS